MIPLRRCYHASVPLLSAVLVGSVWLALFVSFGMRHGEVKEAYRVYAFDRVAESATFRLLANDDYPDWLQRLYRFDDDSLRRKLSRFRETSEQYDLLPESSRVNWAVPFIQLNEGEIAIGILPADSYADEDRERQRKLLLSLAEGESLPPRVTLWADSRYRAGKSQLPEWWVLYSEGTEPLKEWADSNGRKMLRRGIAGDTVFGICLAIGWIAMGVAVFRPTVFPDPIRESPILRQWNSAYVLRHFFIAEIAALVLVGVLAYLPVSGMFADFQMALLHLLFVGLPVIYLALRLFPSPRMVWRLLFKAEKPWNAMKFSLLGMVFVGVFLSLIFASNLLGLLPFAIGDVINADYVDSRVRVAWVVVAASIVAPFFEEFIFRGCLFRGLSQSWGVWPGAILSSGIFAFVHGYSLFGLLAVFLMGLAFCWLFKRSGSLWPGVLGHGIYNFAVVSQSLGWYSLH